MGSSLEASDSTGQIVHELLGRRPADLLGVEDEDVRVVAGSKEPAISEAQERGGDEGELPPSGVNLTALVNRLVKICFMAFSSPRKAGKSRGI